MGRSLVIAILAMLAFPAVPADHGTQELERVVDSARELDPHDLARLVEAKYRELYPEAEPGTWTDDALRSRFDAASTATFYSHSRTIADEMVMLHDMLRSRGAVQAGDLASVVGAQIISRNFAAIERITGSGTLPRAFHVPPIEDAIGGRDGTRWQVLRPGTHRLVRDSYPLDEGKHIVVVSSPLCGFSVAASDAAASDPSVSSVLSEHGVWLVPPARRLYNDEAIEWNEKHPSQRMVLAYRQDDWPIVDNWAMPIFFFVVDGVVVDRIVGWPKDGRNLEPLRAAIDRFVATPVLP